MIRRIRLTGNPPAVDAAVAVIAEHHRLPEHGTGEWWEVIDPTDPSRPWSLACPLFEDGPCLIRGTDEGLEVIRLNHYSEVVEGG